MISIFEISKYAVDQAMRIKAACKEAGYDFLYDSYTNQQVSDTASREDRECCRSTFVSYLAAGRN
jgi:hypothetical protein